MKTISNLLLTLFIFMYASSSFAGEVRVSATVSRPPDSRLPRTGQTTSYHLASGDDLGDDGEIEKGAPVSPSRYKNNAGNTVTDIVTGLTWVKDPFAIGNRVTTIGVYNWNNTRFEWREAFDAIACLNSVSYEGHNDWRMPNIKELQSIVNYGRIGAPYIGETTASRIPFVCQSGIYWSSTHASNSADAWHVDFGNSGLVGRTDANATFQHFVRPVRGGQ